MMQAKESAMDAVSRHFYPTNDELFFFEGDQVCDYSYKHGVKFQGKISDFFTGLPEYFHSGLNAVSAHFYPHPDELFFFKGDQLCDYSYKHGVKFQGKTTDFFKTQIPWWFGKDLNAVTRHFYWPDNDELLFFKEDQLVDASYDKGYKCQETIYSFFYKGPEFNNLPEEYTRNLDAVSGHWNAADELFFFKNGRVCDYSYGHGVKFEGPIRDFFKMLP
jgi:hypothetical protein